MTGQSHGVVSWQSDSVAETGEWNAVSADAGHTEYVSTHAGPGPRRTRVHFTDWTPNCLRVPRPPGARFDTLGRSAQSALHEAEEALTSCTWQNLTLLHKACLPHSRPGWFAMPDSAAVWDLLREDWDSSSHLVPATGGTALTRPAADDELALSLSRGFWEQGLLGSVWNRARGALEFRTYLAFVRAVGRVLHEIHARAEASGSERPEIEFELTDDGALVLQWRLPLRVLALAIEEGGVGSGWYLADARPERHRQRSGEFGAFDAEEVLDLFLTS